MYYSEMNEDIKSEAELDSPQVSDGYRRNSKDGRKNIISQAIPLSYMKYTFEVVDCQDDGSVYFSCSPLLVSERGTILLELESHLKSTVDSGITVWLSPLGDRSALRKLRGVNIGTTKKGSDQEGII